VLGQLDDVILPPGIAVATRLMAPEILDEHRWRAASLAQAPTDWRVAAVIVFWALAAALAARWASARWHQGDRIRA
jgi:hypothetical protein